MTLLELRCFLAVAADRLEGINVRAWNAVMEAKELVRQIQMASWGDTEARDAVLKMMEPEE